MTTELKTNHLAAEPTGAGDAVGVPDRKWFIAVVNNNAEKSTAAKLIALGYDTYVATQEEFRIWRNGKRAKVDRVVIPSVVFVKCTEAERLQIVALPYINRFMTDRASAAKTHANIATVPPEQIDTLRFMLGNSDTPVTISGEYVKGDKVRIARGRLRGLEGEIARDSDGRSKLYINVDLLGFACLEIDPLNVEPLRP